MAQECPLPVEGEPKDQLSELTKDEFNARSTLENLTVNIELHDRLNRVRNS